MANISGALVYAFLKVKNVFFRDKHIKALKNNSFYAMCNLPIRWVNFPTR